MHFYDKCLLQLDINYTNRIVQFYYILDIFTIWWIFNKIKCFEDIKCMKIGTLIKKNTFGML